MTSTFSSVRLGLLAILICACTIKLKASLLIPMDDRQAAHLKAYGIAFLALQQGVEIDWLLNYRGGSFLIPNNSRIHNECIVRGVTVEVISESSVTALLTEISRPNVNMNMVRLERVPRIAVYSPKNAFVGDESDAVINVLDFAEIPYTVIYDQEVIRGDLALYDWIHLHHEDFTGQNGRWLRMETARIEAEQQKAVAEQLGYAKVSALKLDVAKRIRAFCDAGGYLFAMCSGAETFDIALAADGLDISEEQFDGDPEDPDAQQKLDFSKTLAFENFTLESGRKFSDINTGWPGFRNEGAGYFKLFNFSAKWDIIPSMLVQNHEYVIKEFTGQTSAFAKHTVKPQALVLADNGQHVRYIYGESGKGHWTFYSGHDPEGSPGRRRQATDLNLFPGSPGYRLILNNVLFPSARKKKQRT